MLIKRSSVRGKVLIAAALGLSVATTMSACSADMSAAGDVLRNSEYQPELPLSEMIQGLTVVESVDVSTLSASVEDVLQDDTPFGAEASAGGSADSLPQSSQFSATMFPFWIRATDKMGWEKGTNTNCSSKWAAMYRDSDNARWLDEGACVIDSGSTWTDQYGTLDDDGDLEEYSQGGNALRFEVDRIVQTRVAWLHGASEWPLSKREQFANDPLNLQTTSTKAMYQKNAGSASDYIPPGEFSCEYASRYVQVADKYDLSITQDDYDALHGQLDDCGAI